VSDLRLVTNCPETTIHPSVNSGVPSPETKPGFHPKYASTLAKYASTLGGMIQFRYGTREKTPDHLWNLVERLKAGGGPPSSGPRQKADDHHRAEEAPSTICPYCLGLGERAGDNSAQPHSPCSWCGGRGVLRSIPKPTDL
jgi:hypothetical protein